MKKLIAIMMMSLPIFAMLTGCKSDEDKVRETAEAYLYKNMKNPESLKVLSCEIRKDTIPFWLSEDMFDMAETAQKALNRFSYYSDMSYLFASKSTRRQKPPTKQKKHSKPPIRLPSKTIPLKWSILLM